MTDAPLPPGVHVPLITPFAADGSVATDALARLAELSPVRAGG
jgi:dihydrodipicolinate synthase/N-acetylneuraminate lyase